jgi:hypothetical protein
MTAESTVGALLLPGFAGTVPCGAGASLPSDDGRCAHSAAFRAFRHHGDVLLCGLEDSADSRNDRAREKESL